MEPLRKFEVKFTERIDKCTDWMQLLSFIIFPKIKERNYYINETLIRYQIILKAFAASYKLIVSEMDDGGNPWDKYFLFMTIGMLNVR